MKTIQIEQIRPELCRRVRQEALDILGSAEMLFVDTDDNDLHYGAFYGDVLAGVISVNINHDNYEFRHLTILPHLRSKGIGSKLIYYITKIATAQGGKRLWSTAKPELYSFYTKTGFELVTQMEAGKILKSDIAEKLLNR